MRAPLSLDSDLMAGLATPPGSSGVAIIRLSGPGLPERLLPLLRHPHGKSLSPAFFTPRSLHRLDLRDPEAGVLLDQALVVFFPAPFSFTGEDQMEIQGHGSPVVLARIFTALAALGVRMAQPGEFSRRAYQNGKMDLTQAEALMALIHASTLRAAREAARQLQGSLGNTLSRLHEQVLDLLAQVEADLDFSDEEIDPADDRLLHKRLAALLSDMKTLAQGAAWGARLQNGFELVIAGRPNVGKSSVYNRLVGEDKAIVTAIPGTTRDLNEHRVTFEGVPVVLVDTAGLRVTADPIEQEGIRRARARMAQADGIVLLYDVREGLTAQEHQLALEQGPTRLVLVGNKRDLCPGQPPPLPKDLAAHPAAMISCLKGTGIESLIHTIKTLCAGDPCGEEGSIILVSRQREALQRAMASLGEAGTLLEQTTPPKEIVAMMLRQSLEALGELVGETSHTHLLDRIFSTFCIGK